MLNSKIVYNIVNILPKWLISSISRFLISKRVNTKPGAIIIKTYFEGRNSLLNNVELDYCHIGYATYISKKTVLSKTKVGRFCSIGSEVKTGMGVHPHHFVSTHPLFHSSIVSQSLNLGYFKDIGERFNVHTMLENNYYVDIGSDVWIGDRVMIMDGVKIGNGSVIGAGSIVTKDVDDYAIVAGIPAKKIKYRFDKKDIDLLLKFKWWNKDIDWIIRNSKHFNDIDFIRNNFII